MVQILEVGSPAHVEQIKAAVDTALEYCKANLKQDELLTQEEAMQLLKIKSRQKMQAIRDEDVIKWKMLGGEIRYSRKSIEKWINS